MGVVKNINGFLSYVQWAAVRVYNGLPLSYVIACAKGSHTDAELASMLMCNWLPLRFAMGFQYKMQRASM